MNSNWLGLTNLFHDSTNCKKELRRMILIQGRINSPPSDADGWARAVWKTLTFKKKVTDGPTGGRRDRSTETANSRLEIR